MQLSWSKLINLDDAGIGLAPNKAGIYRIWYYEGGKWHPCYVGQADDLRKRLAEHASTNEQNSRLRTKVRNSRCYFRYALVALQKDRDDCELAMYNHYDGLFNEISPPSNTPAKINFE